MRVFMLNPGPLIQSIFDPILKIVTNLRREVDPEEDHSSQNCRNTGQEIIALSQYQLAQKTMLPSIIYSLLFYWVMVIF